MNAEAGQRFTLHAQNAWKLVSILFLICCERRNAHINPHTSPWRGRGRIARRDFCHNILCPVASLVGLYVAREICWMNFFVISKVQFTWMSLADRLWWKQEHLTVLHVLMAVAGAAMAISISVCLWHFALVTNLSTFAQIIKIKRLDWHKQQKHSNTFVGTQ